MLPFEDQLDRDERVRVEALALAIQFATAQGPVDVRSKDTTIASIAASVHELADEFRKYIEDGLPVDDEEEEEDRE